MSLLDSILQTPLDPIFRLQAEFEADSRPGKINLGIGIYADEMGESYVLPSVRRVVTELSHTNFDYLPLRGDSEYLRLASDWVFGDTAPKHIALQATSGGTHACRLFADLVLRADSAPELIIGTPTWGNHMGIFRSFGITTVPHLASLDRVNDEGYIEAIGKAKKGAVVVLHGGAAHNPTGINFTPEELDRVIDAANEKDDIVFVDAAYLGLGESRDADRAFVRRVATRAHRSAMAVSFSKAATLYKHRAGFLAVVSPNADAIESQLQQICREQISTPPAFGQEVMREVLGSERGLWEGELDQMRESIDSRRTKLVSLLPPAFAHVGKTRGLFALTGLSEEQVERLKKEFAVYLPGSGRINIAGLTKENIPVVANALQAVSAPL